MDNFPAGTKVSVHNVCAIRNLPSQPLNPLNGKSLAGSALDGSPLLRFRIASAEQSRGARLAGEAG